ncbi:hypothetical protein MTR67_017630 [Solanum verrucosum]|uniref:FBD domain-containing protein n=1 Tax=Solanum verrucosum TaxID=315347 RepID=A0AAF0QKV0_SOLVR|nr:hypothetical protein MTR67_017630 [Solanum verrucosum]
MTSPKCRRLELIHHGHLGGDWYSFEGDTYCFEIVAPYVQHLTISGVFDDTRIKVRDFSSLNHANLDLYYDENTVEDVLVSVCCANELILSSWLIKYEDKDIDLLEDRKYHYFEENIIKVSLHNLKNVKAMPLYGGMPTSDVTKLDQFLKFLLEHAINLEKLVIVPEHKECNSCSTNTSNLKNNLFAFPTSAIISLQPVRHNFFVRIFETL